MKKHLLLIAVFFTALIAQAQEPYTADFLYIHSGFETELMNIVEMRDDILMANIRNENSYNYGDYFIKFSKQGAVVYDSTFIQSN